MTDTLQAPPTTPEPPSPAPSNRAAVVLAIVAAIAVTALAAVAIVAVAGRNDGHQPMMDNTGNMPGSMMNGSMMNGHGSSSPTVPGAREIAVTASSFRFTPTEIHVKAGEDVTVVLAAADIAHDFTIDALGVHVSASPGQPGRG